MATVAAPPQKLTPAEYLVWERAQPKRPLYEYYDGEIVEMPGASRAHVRIGVNLARALGNQLEDRPGEIFDHDMRVAIDSGRSYVYPDLSVVADEPRFLEDQFDTLLNPTVLVETLSPSTEATDRGRKLPRYRQLESLREFLFIAQDLISVEHYARRGDEWVLTVFERPEDVVRLESIGCAVPLSAIYAKVIFPDEGAPRA